MKAWVAILVGLLNCAVTAHSRQTPTPSCRRGESLNLPDKNVKELSAYAFSLTAPSRLFVVCAIALSIAGAGAQVNQPALAMATWYSD
jgi:hypothetical protein